MENTDSKLRWIYLCGFFLIAALPFLNLPPWFSPPDWGKTIVFRIALSLIIFLFIWQILGQRKFSIKLSLPLRLLIALFMIFLLANIFSLDRTFSFWGSPYRSGGFVNFAFYIIFAILVFLTLHDKDWQRIWDFTLVIGGLVSLVAVFQQFNILSKFIIPFEGRPPSTIGGSIFLAIYLLLLSFLTTVFGIREKNLKKRCFYFLLLLLFIFVIFITGSRAVYLGLVIGILYFIFFYPKKVVWLKIGAGLLLILGIIGISYLNTHSTEIFSNTYILEHQALKNLLDRFSIHLFLIDPRFSGWQVALKALREKPILGYGSENLAIGFDKYYDPSLPYITKEWGSWWDRAHNFILDISITAGIPALIIYLSIFGVLFWQLQKLRKINPDQSLIYHGIQTTFLAYFTANFFSFDTSSTYLISFLLIGYSLSLTSKNIPEKNFCLDFKGKNIIIFIIFSVLVWFIWVFNIKPLEINKEIKVAVSQAEIGNYKDALNKMESLLKSRSFLDSYVRLNYIEIINGILARSTEQTQISLAEKARQILKENTKIQPYYTRNWLLLGNYTNVLIEKGETDLKDEANTYFEKAHQLSPKRQEVFIGWTKAYFLAGDYLGAKDKAQKCLDLNKNQGDCWWLMALINIHLNKNEETQEDIKISGQNGYLVDSEDSLLQLATAYTETKNYKELIKIYQDLLIMKPLNPQYHAFLAVAYKEASDFKNARTEALKVIELSPQSKEIIEKFLKDLP